MNKFKLLFFHSVFILYVYQSATGFNLEPRIPVIKFGRRPHAYFGFSVAEHQTITEDGQKISWMLVGAPLDQNLQPNTTQSGALWKCPVTTRPNDCQQVVTDGKRIINSDDLRAPMADEKKDGQWLGVTVRSKGPGGKAVVCAHRYIWSKGESYFGMGLCYQLTNELTYDDIWEPCKGRPWTREHEEFGYCQAGISSSVLEDGSLLIGSPGSYTWKGTVFNRDISGDYLSRDSTHYYAPVTDGTSPVEKYSYLGMSVAGGRFLSSNMSYASGAPRSRGTGQVVLFSKRLTNEYGDTFGLLNVSLILDGEQFGSSFGYELATADVNGDGLPDLLVGAPFYFSKNTGGAVYLYLNNEYSLGPKYDLRLTGRPESQYGISIANAGDLNKDGCDDIAIGSPYEGNGVVYIYLGHRKNGLYSEPTQVIQAQSLPVVIKTFGYSLSGGIDMDFNGYPDLLVGAYEMNSAVLIRSRPIIDIKTYVETWSSTLSNIDPSKHGCDSDPGANYTCFHFTVCCSMEVAVNTLKANTHNLSYVIEAETFGGSRKFSRVFFQLSESSQKSNIIKKSIEMPKNTQDCREHIVYLKENTRDIQTPIKVNYSLVQQEPSYVEEGDLPNVDDYPVLNATASTTFMATFLNDCGQDGVCISDLRVGAKLDLPKSSEDKQYTLILGQETEIRLEVTVNNYGESAYETQMYVTHHQGMHFIAANTTDKHVICSIRNKTTVVCSLGNPYKKIHNSRPIILRFDPKPLDDNDQTIDFNIWVNSTSKEAKKARKPVSVSATVVKNAELSIKGTARPEQVFYGGEVKGESAMHYFDDVGSRVVHTYQVFNEGPWHVGTVQVVVLWPQQVANNKPQGKWLLYPEAIPTVEGENSSHSAGECIWPKIATFNPLALENRPGYEEPPLELREPFLMPGKGPVKEQHNDTLKSINLDINKIRRKRDTEMVVRAEAYTDKDGQRKHVVNMNCQNKTAKCIEVKCVIYKLARNEAATISIRARLWNSTLVEDYPRVSHINIASRAYIYDLQSYNIKQNNEDDDSYVVETVAYPDLKPTEPTEIPLWVIIVAVLAGLLVLILLIIALWKLGFFKRSRPDPTLSGNLEKNTHEGSPFLASDRNGVR